MLREISDWLEERHGIYLAGALGFENTYALAMPRQQAAELGIITIRDLSRHSPTLRMGSDYEFYGRPEWKGLRDRYGLAFRELRTFDPTLMYAAVKEGEVDVISAYSTDGRILLYDLQILEDPLGALPPYDAVRRANKMVDIDGASVDEAAEFLLSEISVKKEGVDK